MRGRLRRSLIGMAKTEDRIDALTREEINRRIVSLEEKKRLALAEMIALDHPNSAGVTVERVAPDDERAAREVAALLLNDAAPPALYNADSPRMRLQELGIQVRAIDIAVEILRSNEVAVRAAGIMRWAEAHEQEWRELCRRTVLTERRLLALQRHAQALRGTCPGPSLPASWPMREWIGTGDGIVDPGLRRTGVPGGPQAEALAAGLVTERDLRAAEEEI